MSAMKQTAISIVKRLVAVDTSPGFQRRVFAT